MNRINRVARRWWPFTATLVAGMALLALGYVVSVVAEERDELRLQKDQLAVQSAQLAKIIERNEIEDASREQRLNRAVASVEELLIDHFASHDRNVAEKLNELLERIAVLVNRPPPEPIAPASPHEPDRGQSTTTTTTAPRPPPSSTTTTTTTSPGRSDLCETVPTALPCRRNR